MPENMSESRIKSHLEQSLPFAGNDSLDQLRGIYLDSTASREHDESIQKS